MVNGVLKNQGSFWLKKRPFPVRDDAPITLTLIWLHLPLLLLGTSSLFLPGNKLGPADLTRTAGLFFAVIRPGVQGRERVHLRREMAGLEAYSPFRKSGAPT